VITVLTADSQLPYDRAKLSKQLDVTIDSISLRDRDYFAKNNIAYKTRERVQSIKFAEKLVTCQSGNEYQYDKLVIATGLRPLLLDRPGSGSKGIFTIRSLDDVTAIHNYFKACLFCIFT
jgi:nitrite reductase (NADH) large subunit